MAAGLCPGRSAAGRSSRPGALLSRGRNELWCLVRSRFCEAALRKSYAPHRARDTGASLHPQLRIDRDEAAVVGVADRSDAVDARAVDQAVLQGKEKIAAQENAVFHRGAL